MTFFFIKLSFPKVVVGNPLFVVVVILRNDRSRIKTFRDDGKKQYSKAIIKIGVILNWWPAGFSESTFWVVAVKVQQQQTTTQSVDPELNSG